ncbi:MAG: thermonuclease family protein [Rhizobium sp.]
MLATSALIICTSLAVVDGDTIKCDGQNMRLLGEGVVNVRGIDTPEIGRGAKCDKERKLAHLAKFRLEALLVGQELRIESKGRDRYGRPLVNVYLPNGREVGKQLLVEGFAREWRKGQKIDWCS